VAGREDIREFKAFRLYGRQNPKDPWTQLDSFTPTHPFRYKDDPNETAIRSVALQTPFTGRYFRAEFDQYDSPLEAKRGPRILEIEGIGAVAQ
jgi:hypothetical protein